MEYRQNKNAIVASYVIYRWFPALYTCFISCIVDYLNYKNTKLVFTDRFLVYETGAFTKRIKEISYEDILNIRAEQSFLGQHLKYATVTAVMKNHEDSIVFKFAGHPEALRRAIQEKFVASQKLKIS